MNYIIKESDNRYQLLGNLWSRLNSGELKITRYTSNGGLQYVIPKELVNNEFSRYTGRGNLIESSKSHDSYIITYRFESILRQSCELNKEQYYHLMMMKNNDLDESPTCCICGKKLDFSNKLGQGYHQGAGNPSCDYYTCSKSCKSSKILIDGWRKGCYDDSTDLRGFKVAWSKDYKKMYYSAHNPIKEAEVRRSIFISRSNGRHSYLYILVVGDKLKFGITSYNPDGRVNYVINNILCGIPSVKLYYEGGNIEVADAEYNLKILLYNLGFISTSNSEIFYYSDDLLELIKTKVSETLSLYNS